MRQASMIPLTHDGWRRLPAELAALRRQRDALLRDFARDRESESDATMLAQLRAELDLLDARIAELAAALERAAPAEPAERSPGTVGVGSRVTVRWDDGDEATYTVVGSLEVDSGADHVSCESPVGRALLGRSAADWVEVATPARRQRLLVVAVMDHPLAPPAEATGQPASVG
jgi:transcription elongation factor GreA